MPELDVRPSPIAGTWYEMDPQALARSVDAYIASAVVPELNGDVVALIAPHAGHRYSGAVAGHAFALLRGMKPDLVVLISPMHHAYAQPLLTTAHEAYATPLGDVLVDGDAISDLNSRLWQKLSFGLTPVSADPEHSLEIELPFLQRVLGNSFRLLPLMMRNQSQDVARNLGLALADMLHGRSALLVASTDLSHFYDEKTANRLDSAMLEQVAAFSPEGLYHAEAHAKGEACGLGAMAAVMWAARELGADSARVLKHGTSGDVTGDIFNVVGYGAAVLYRSRSG